MLSASEIESGAQRLYEMANRPKRKGGVGPLQRQYLTMERCRNAIKAVEAEGMEGFAAKDRNSPSFKSERAALEERAAARAKAMESGSIISLISIFLPLILPLLKVLIAKWIDSRLNLSTED